MREREALEFVYSQVAEDIDAMYQYYRKKMQLEDERDTERQLEILIDKKYISQSYMVNLVLISDYYFRGMAAHYCSSIQDYKNRIHFLLER